MPPFHRLNVRLTGNGSENPGGLINLSAAQKSPASEPGFSFACGGHFAIFLDTGFFGC